MLPDDYVAMQAHYHVVYVKAKRGLHFCFMSFKMTLLTKLIEVKNDLITTVIEPLHKTNSTANKIALLA